MQLLPDGIYVIAKLLKALAPCMADWLLTL
jgi:hypothetical protein